jgi:uncharacterized protein (TIGR02444 family)
MAKAFWDFSLQVYAVPGVADECASLQDQFGTDVNLLLFGAYMGGQRVLLSRDDVAQISAVVQAWHEHVVKPLRSARRATKQMLKSSSDSVGKPVEALRKKVKALELESEEIEQNLLDEWARTRPRLPASSDAEAAIDGNIRLLLEFSGAAGHGACSPATLIQASLAAAKPAGTS